MPVYELEKLEIDDIVIYVARYDIKIKIVSVLYTKSLIFLVNVFH